MTLTTYEYIWAVRGIDLNDYYPTTYSYWSEKEKADDEAERLNMDDKNYQAKSVQVELMRDNAGNYYKVEINEVVVDPFTKEQVLSKLSPKERKALGFK